MAKQKGMLSRVWDAVKGGKRAYDGASAGRRTDGWVTGNASANSETMGQLARLRDRSSDLCRNNPTARKARDALVSSIIGAGIMPRADTGDAALDEEIMAAFRVWQEECDAAGQLDLAGLQSLACRGMVERGETLTRMRPRSVRDGLHVPMQLQIMEGDFLDHDQNNALNDGNRIVQGVEFNAIDQRRAYWLYATHPGDPIASLRLRTGSAPVPAGQIAHLYLIERPGQVRGVPWLSTVIRKLWDIDGYVEAEILRKRTEACVAGIAFNPEGEEDADGISGMRFTDADGNTVERFEPGMLAYATGAKDIRFTQPAATGGFAEWMRVMDHRVAAGANLPYELLTGDLSQVNYSSIRAGLNEFHRLAETWQWQVFIPMWCRPVWRWFIDSAFAAGRISRAAYGVKWNPPGFASVDAMKDAMADLVEVRSGAMTWPQMVAKRGYDPMEQLREIARFAQEFDALDLVLDSDPRQTDKAGAIQAAMTAAATEAVTGGNNPARQ